MAFQPLDAVPVPDPDDAEYRPRRVWPIWLAVGVVALAALGLGIWKLATAPDPRRILPVVDLDGKWWEGAEGAAVLADNLSDRLEAMGFLVVRAGDPKVTRVLEAEKSAEEAAAALGAAWVLEVDFTLSEHEHPIEGGYAEVRAEGAVTLRRADAEPVTSAPVSSWSGAKKRAQALNRLGDSLADRVFDAALPLLVQHPALREVFEARTSSPDSALADKLRKAREYVAERKAALEAAEKKYEDTARRREQGERGPVPVTFHSGTAANDGLCGVGAAGALIKTDDAPLFFIPEKRTLGRLSALESLAWLPADGPARPLWTGYNLYSYPALGADGESAVVVEDLFGWAKAITRIAPDGKATRLRVDPTHRYSAGRISRGNRLLAIEDSPCRECPVALLVLNAEDGQEVLTILAAGGELAGWAWVAERTLAVIYTPSGEAPAADAVFTDTGPQTGLYTLELAPGVPPKATFLWRAEDPAERLSWLSASGDGQRLAFAINRAGQDAIGLFDLAERTPSRLEPGVRCSAPSLSPDGRAVAFQWLDERGGDEEVGLMSTAGGPARRLTDNSQRDRYPRFSPDGARIFFESLGDDPNFPRTRSVSRIASVPAAPGGP